MKTLKKIYHIFHNFKNYNKIVNSQIETSNAILRHQINSKPITNIKVAFLIHNINAWFSIGEIIREMQQNSNFEIFIFSIRKKFPGERRYTEEEKVHNFLESLKIPHIRLNMQDSFSGLNIIKRFEPNVIFRQSQWDNDYPPAFSTLHLNFTNLAYISYELVNPIINVPLDDDIIDSAVDSYFHRNCWKVFCANEYVVQQAQKGKMLGKQFVVTGHPKIDYHINNKEKFWPSKTEAKRKIFWTSHHSILTGWNNFGMFHKIYKDMLEWAKEDKDTSFAWHPHPALTTLLNSSKCPISKKELKIFFNTWNSLPNCSMYLEENYPALLNSCDFILSDSPSIIIEGQFYNKPILFFDRPDRVEFNEIGNILKTGFLSIKNIQQAKSYIEQNNFSEIISHQNRNINNLFSSRNASKNIITYIEKSFLT